MSGLKKKKKKAYAHLKTEVDPKCTITLQVSDKSIFKIHEKLKSVFCCIINFIVVESINHNHFMVIKTCSEVMTIHHLINHDTLLFPS